MAVSKTVANWSLVVRTVVTAIRHFGPELAAGLEQELFPEGLPARLTMALVLSAFADALERRLAAVRDADQALAVERADDAGLRDGRDEAVRELRTLMLRSGASVEGGYGEDATVRVGLDGRLPDDLDQLVGQARAVAALLTPENLGAPSSVIPGVSIDPAALASAFRAAADLLDGRLTDVRADQREDQDALSVRDSALDMLASAYSGIANVTVGVALFLGRQDIADRVRVTAARRAGRPEPEDLSVDPADPAGDGGGVDTPA